MEEIQKKSSLTLWGVGVLVVAAITFGAVKFTKKEVTEPTDEASGTSEESSSTQTTDYIYKDGTYSAVSTYTTPAGPEEINVSITLKGDIISDAVVVGKATNEVSIKLQSMFIGGLKAVVVGKNIEDVVLNKVAGSSLTPKGWNEAVVKIQAQAKI